MHHSFVLHVWLPLFAIRINGCSRKMSRCWGVLEKTFARIIYFFGRKFIMNFPKRILRYCCAGVSQSSEFTIRQLYKLFPRKLPQNSPYRSRKSPQITELCKRSDKLHIYPHQSIFSALLAAAIWCENVARKPSICVCSATLPLTPGDNFCWGTCSHTAEKCAHSSDIIVIARDTLHGRQTQFCNFLCHTIFRNLLPNVHISVESLATSDRIRFGIIR